MDEIKLKAFYDIYIEGDFEDPHTKFSEVLGISRQEAKMLCYQIAYKISQSRFIKAYFIGDASE